MVLDFTQGFALYVWRDKSKVSLASVSGGVKGSLEVLNSGYWCTKEHFEYVSLVPVAKNNDASTMGFNNEWCCL